MSIENKIGDITIFNNYKKTEQKHPDYLHIAMEKKFIFHYGNVKAQTQAQNL